MIEKERDLKDVIYDFVRNRDDKNILLLDLPTGTGKTWSVVQFMADRLEEGLNHRIIFITPLKKNLPRKELEEELRRRGRPDLIEEILELPPISRHVLKEGSKDGWDKDGMKEFLEDDTLFNKLDSYWNRSRENPLPPEGTEDYKIIIGEFEKAEWNVRKKISAKIACKWPEEEERMKILKNPDMSWLEFLYPSIRSYDCHVIMMSAAKFLYGNDPLIDNAFVFYESDFIDGATIFIDEFDSVKTDMLNNLISDARRIDVMDTFNGISNGLDDILQRRPEYFDPARKGDDDAEKAKAKTIRVAEEAARLKSLYHLEYDFKTEEATNSYIIRDYRLWTVGSLNRFEVDTDGDNRVNRIKFGKRTSPVIMDVSHFFIEFQNLMAFLSRRYEDAMDKMGKPVSFESALKTMLRPYRLNKDQTDFFKDRIMYSGRPRNNTRRNTPFLDDHSVYNNGIHIYDIEDADDHGLTSCIFEESYHRTPEMILLKTLSRECVRVVGLSATATLPSVVSNFDLDYMSYRKEYRVYDLSEKDRECISRIFRDHTGNYEGVEIVPVQINPDPYKGMIDDDLCRDDALNIMPSGKEKEYLRDRYIRISKAYRFMLDHPDIMSMLCFTTAQPKDTGPYNKTDLTTILHMVALSAGVREEDRPTVKFLSKDKFDERKSDILTRLSKGDRVFLVTSYMTIGAGQNLQYKIPEGVNTVRVNNLREDDKKDFDAIYLDKPTNIIPQIYKDEHDNLIKTVFNIEFLLESREMNRDEARDAINKAFKRYHSGEGQTPGILDSRSCVNAYGRTLIQAVGRICRTVNKNQKIYLLADEEIPKHLSRETICYTENHNPEFETLFRMFEEMGLKGKTSADESWDLPSERAGDKIQSMLTRGVWSEDRMNFWRRLRDTLLKHPTFHDKEGGGISGTMYTKIDGTADRIYYCRSENNSYGIQVSMSPRGGFQELSAEACRLPKLMAIPCVKKHFEKMSYATEFPAGERIMCPALFNDVYKGALGEAAGKAIFESWNLPLQEITNPSKFEKFDFMYSEDEYVDFKHWNADPRGIDGEEELNKVFDKLRDVGGRTAIIANILLPEDREVKHLPYTRERDGMSVLVVPCLYMDGLACPEAFSKVKEVLRA